MHLWNNYSFYSIWVEYVAILDLRKKISVKFKCYSALCRQHAAGMPQTGMTSTWHMLNFCTPEMCFIHYRFYWWIHCYNLIALPWTFSQYMCVCELSIYIIFYISLLMRINGCMYIPCGETRNRWTGHIDSDILSRFGLYKLMVILYCWLCHLVELTPVIVCSCDVLWDDNDRDWNQSVWWCRIGRFHVYEDESGCCFWY